MSFFYNTPNQDFSSVFTYPIIHSLLLVSILFYALSFFLVGHTSYLYIYEIHENSWENQTPRYKFEHLKSMSKHYKIHTLKTL